MLLTGCSHGLHSSLRKVPHQLLRSRIASLKRPPVQSQSYPAPTTVVSNVRNTGCGLNLKGQCRVLVTKATSNQQTTTRSIPLTLSSLRLKAGLLRTNTPLMATEQSRGHAGHHHHHGDNAYLTSANRNDAGVRITLLGLYVNIGMAIAKGLGGYYFHSHSLSADAVHSLTDTASDVMTWLTITFSRKPPTEAFPSGYGKVESLGALGVSGLLLWGGVVIGQDAVTSLLNMYTPEMAETLESIGLLGHGHGHSHSHEIASLGAAWLSLATVALKFWLYRATMKVAKDRKSSVLSSNAYHHLVDCYSGLLVFAAIGASHIFPAFQGFDSLGGLLISLLVIRTGWANTKTSLFELADASMDEEIKSKITKVADKALAELGQPVILNSINGIKSGQNYLIDLELGIPSSWDLLQMKEVEEAVRERIGNKVRGARRIRVRFSAQEDKGGFLEEFIRPEVSPKSSPEPDEHEHEHDHDHSHADGNGHDHGHNGDLKKRR